MAFIDDVDFISTPDLFEIRSDVTDTARVLQCDFCQSPVRYGTALEERKYPLALSRQAGALVFTDMIISSDHPLCLETEVFLLHCISLSAGLRLLIVHRCGARRRQGSDLSASVAKNV